MLPFTQACHLFSTGTAASKLDRDVLSRMLRRRVPVSRLGSRDPRGDQKSLRLCCKAFASMCKACASSCAVENRRETQNCRCFWPRVGSSRLKSANSHADRRGPGRQAQNCRHCWTHVGSSRLKSANAHADRVGPGRKTQNCPHFWTCGWNRRGPGRQTQKSRHFWICFWSSRLKGVNSHGDRGGPGRETQNCPHFWTCVLS